MHRRAEQADQPRPEAKFLNADQGLHARFCRVGICGAENPKPLAGNVQAIGQPHVKVCQFHFRLEARGKSFNDSGAQDGLGMGKQMTGFQDHGDG